MALLLLLLGLVPPLDPPLRITSSFGEYRQGRFHTGVDLSTGGKKGKPVYAVADGEIRRIRVSVYGYGKALYVRLRNGHWAIYAHLDHFRRDIDSLVYLRQIRTRRYAQDFWPDPPIPVREGEVIAYSGATGIGAPHLHFELRTPNNRPYNPPLSLFGPLHQNPSTPRLEGLTLIPLQGPWPLRRRPPSRGPLFLDLSGPFVLQVRVLPPPLELEAWLDGQKIYHLQKDTLDFRENLLAHTLYHYEGGRLSRAEIKLYRSSPLPPFVREAPENLNLSPGAHHLVLKVRTYTASRTFEVPIEVPSTPTGFSPEWLEGLRWDLEEENLRLALLPQGAVWMLPPPCTLQAKPLGETRGSQVYFLSEPGWVQPEGKNCPARIALRMVRFGLEGGRLSLGPYTLEIPPGALTGPSLFYTLPAETLFAPRYPDLLLPARILGPQEALLTLDRDFQGIGSFETYTLGRVGQVTDTLPPRIRALALRPRGLTLKLWDPETGVEPSSITGTLDGQWIPLEYDPEERRLRFRSVLSPIPCGSHRLRIEVRDHAGNLRTYRKTFTL